MKEKEQHGSCLVVIRPDGSSLLLRAESNAELSEWKEVLSAATTKRNPQDDIWLEVGRVRSCLPSNGHHNPDCRGLLHQMDTAGAWSRWLLVLLDGCLYIYSELDPESSARGVIFLHGYRAQSGSVAGKRHSFEMVPSDPQLRHFYFFAQTETEKKRWLAALEYSIDRWMRLS